MKRVVNNTTPNSVPKHRMRRFNEWLQFMVFVGCYALVKQPQKPMRGLLIKIIELQSIPNNW